MTNVFKFKELASTKLHAQRDKLRKEIDKVNTHRQKISNGERWKDKGKYLKFLDGKTTKLWKKLEAIDKRINAIRTKEEAA